MACELELPGAIPEAPPVAQVDVTVRRGPAPSALDSPSARGPSWEIAGDRFLLRVPRLARFLVTAGRDIVVDIELGVAVPDVAGFVLGTAFGILLHQRGALVLHGAAVARNGRAIVVCGESGAGKSTLAAALCNSGCSFLTDDICVVALKAESAPIVLPDGRQLKLWTRSIDQLDLDDRKCGAVRDTFEKFYVQPRDVAAGPQQLSAICVLRKTRHSAKADIRRLALPDAMRRLDREAYRPRFRMQIGQKPELLAQSAAVLNHAGLFMLVHPHGFEHLSDTAATVREHWSALGR